MIKLTLKKYSLKRIAEKKLLLHNRHYNFWQCMDTLREKIVLNQLYYKKNVPWIIKKELF